MLSRFGYLLVLVCAAVVMLPAAGRADDHSPNMTLEYSLNDFTSGRTHSDLAFWGNIAVAGNYDGFRVFNTDTHQLLVSYLCRGPQNDVSLWEHNGRLLLFQSIDTPQRNGESVCSPNRGSDTSACGPVRQRTLVCFEGIRIFDLTDPAQPVYVKAVYTGCGSHTHTLVPDEPNNRLLLYVSSYPGSSGRRCQSPFRKFSIVQVPLDAPETSRVISQPTIVGGAPGCHDMTAFLAIHKMAAMCATEGQIWDISDPANPDTTHPLRIDDPTVNYWHSAEFTWDGLYVVTNDESFTGTCLPSDDGKIRVWRVSDGQLMSSFMIPRPQGANYCSVHNGNIIPIAGQYLLVAAWYGGGTSVVDFTNPSQPIEIGYYVATTGRRADTWSSYWYNGKIYTNDITRGQDVLHLDLPGTPDIQTWDYLNPQTQENLYPPPIGSMTPLARLTRRALTP